MTKCLVKYESDSREECGIIKGAFSLTLATLIVKLLGLIYKIPLSNMIGTVGRGLFDSAYSLYVIISLHLKILAIMSHLVQEIVQYFQIVLTHYRFF